jgi:hypothetical protein
MPADPALRKGLTSAAAAAEPGGIQQTDSRG